MQKTMSNLLPAAVMAIVTMMAVAWLSLFSVKVGEPVAVIFPPWTDDAAAFHSILSTNSLIIRTGLTSNILIVQPGHSQFADDIRALGAWAVVNPFNIATCGSINTTT